MIGRVLHIHHRRSDVGLWADRFRGRSATRRLKTISWSLSSLYDRMLAVSGIYRGEVI